MSDRIMTSFRRSAPRQEHVNHVSSTAVQTS